MNWELEGMNWEFKGIFLEMNWEETYIRSNSQGVKFPWQRNEAIFVIC